MSKEPKQPSLEKWNSASVWPFPSGTVGFFGLALDSQERLMAVVLSSDRLALCLKRMTDEHAADVESGYALLMREEKWVTLLRDFDEFFGIVGPEGMLEETPVQPEGQEAIHAAVEVALSLWPEWGTRLRSTFQPRPPLFLYSTAEDLVS